MHRTTFVFGSTALALGLAGAPAAQEEGPLSHDAVVRKVTAIRADDVAWRQIPWRTCLLDGLAAAQRDNKPIMMWCHIDRPVDDTRC